MAKLEFITESMSRALSVKKSLISLDLKSGCAGGGMLTYPTPPCFAKRVRKRLKTMEGERQKRAKSEKEAAST